MWLCRGVLCACGRGPGRGHSHGAWPPDLWPLQCAAPSCPEVGQLQPSEMLQVGTDFQMRDYGGREKIVGIYAAPICRPWLR